MAIPMVLVGAGFRRYSRYRGAMVGGAFTNTVFGLLRASIVSATITAAGGRLGGYAVASGITYAWVTQAVIAPLQLFGWTELADRVRSGDIAIDVARPVDLQLQYGAADLGRAAAVAVPRAVPPLAVGAVTFGLALPSGVLPYLAGTVSLLLALGISFGCRYLVNLLTFWLVDVRGVIMLYVTASNVLCGLIVPVHWFPGWLGTIAAATPFPSMVQAPVDLLTGRVGGTATAGLLAVQLAWFIGVLAAGQVTQRLGARTLLVQGG
jgi:ABC-2 type transport system permease protein